MSDKTVREYFGSGELSSEHTENAEGHQEGVSRRWYGNGQLWIEAHYSNGKAHGLLREWNENGQLIMQAERANDVFHGRFDSWWENGLPKEQGHYLNGKRQPGYCWYRIDGTLWSHWNGGEH